MAGTRFLFFNLRSTKTRNWETITAINTVIYLYWSTINTTTTVVLSVVRTVVVPGRGPKSQRSPDRIFFRVNGST